MPATTQARQSVPDGESRATTVRTRLVREIRAWEARVTATAGRRTRAERTANTRAANSLRRTRRQLAAVEQGRPIADWIDIQLA
jgi:hypothetical protein